MSDKIEYLFPNNGTVCMDEFLETFDGHVSSFGNRYDLIVEISNRLLASGDKDFMPIGSYFRMSNINKLIDEYSKYQMVPRGNVFYITPSNTDIVFAYVFLLSVLFGNNNIVRVSSNRSDRVQKFCDIISGIDMHDFEQSNCIVTLEKGCDAMSRFSNFADCRVFWGDDETVGSLVQMPHKLMCRDILFGHKYSYAIINSDSEIDFNDLSRRFISDVVWLNQMSCSSPKSVFFVGNNCEEVSDIFWGHIKESVNFKKFSLNTATHRLVNKSIIAASGKINVKYDNPLVIYNTVEGIDRSDFCYWTFFEYFLDKIDDILDIVLPCDQTLSYYGFQYEDMIGLSSNIKNGINRIVPIGQSNVFSHLWDGYDLICELNSIREVL